MYAGFGSSGSVDRWPDEVLPRVSVVVAFREAESCILDCLESIFANDYPHDRLEVIAIDDSYDDVLSGLILSRFPSVVLIRNKVSMGFDGTKDVGLKAATGEIVAHTDADCTVAPSWISAVANNIRNGADAVTGPVRHPKTFLRELIAVADFPDSQIDKRRSVAAFPGCNFATRKSLFSKIGWRREGVATGSDRLLSWHLYKHGGSIHYDPGMTVFHSPQIRVCNLLERRIRYSRTALVIRKTDPSLPGGMLAKLGLLAAPAYIVYKSIKDTRCVWKMACHGQINCWHIPLLLPGLFLFRLMDGFGIVLHQLQSTIRPQEAC